MPRPAPFMWVFLRHQRHSQVWQRVTTTVFESFASTHASPIRWERPTFRNGRSLKPTVKHRADATAGLPGVVEDSRRRQMVHQPRQAPPAPRRFDFLRGLRYSFMSQRVTSRFLSMICVFLCVFAVGPRIRDGAGAIMIRKGSASGQSGKQLIVVRVFAACHAFVSVHQ